MDQVEAERKRYRWQKAYLKALRGTIAVLTYMAAVAALIATLVLPVLQIEGTSIRKVWNIDENTQTPEQVTIQLLRGDTVVETVLLNEENGWQKTFFDLPESDDYSVKELNAPQGYTATYSQSGYTFTVTNTPSLAQTGQLVWPIPIFATAGFFFLIVGFILVRKPGKKNA